MNSRPSRPSRMIRPVVALLLGALLASAVPQVMGSSEATIPPKIQAMLDDTETMQKNKVEEVVEYEVKGEKLYYFKGPKKTPGNVPTGHTYLDANGETAMVVVIGGVVGIQIAAPKPSRFTLEDYRNAKRLRVIWPSSKAP